MPEVTQTSITVDGITLTVQIERKPVKHINARLRGTVLTVSAPRALSQQALDGVIPDLARRLVRRVRAREINQQEDALALAQRVAQRFPQPPKIAHVEFVTTQQRRWGSYSPASGTIRLNAALRVLPRWVLEAVVAHELAHIAHPDHSPAFWALLRHACPATDRAEAFLAGVSWLATSWQQLPPIERALLSGVSNCEEEGTNGARGEGMHE